MSTESLRSGRRWSGVRCRSSTLTARLRSVDRIDFDFRAKAAMRWPAYV